MENVVSFVLPDHHPKSKGNAYVNGFLFRDGVCVVNIAIADQAGSILIPYYNCEMHAGRYEKKNPKKKKASAAPARKKITGTKLERPPEIIEEA